MAAVDAPRLHVWRCEVCGLRHSRPVGPGAPPRYCPEVDPLGEPTGYPCAEWARQRDRYMSATRKLFAHPAMRGEGSGSDVTPKGLRMRIRHRLRDAWDSLRDVALDAADDARDRER